MLAAIPMPVDLNLFGHVLPAWVAGGSAGAAPFPLPVVVAAGFLLLFGLVALGFLILGQRIGRVSAQVGGRERRTSTLESELEAQALLVRQMSIDLEELRARVGQSTDAMTAVGSTWPVPDMPVNLNRRGQIIRLSRKGKSVAEIAQDLHVAQGEVELLLKVHDLSPKAEPESF